MVAVMSCKGCTYPDTCSYLKRCVFSPRALDPLPTREETADALRRTIATLRAELDDIRSTLEDCEINMDGKSISGGVLELWARLDGMRSLYYAGVEKE